MAKIYFQDLRGWDCSDPFGLPLIGALDTLESEGLVKRKVKNRKRIGEINLALCANLDYYSFLLTKAVNIARKSLIEESKANPLGIRCESNKHLGLTYYVESLFKILITIDELIKQMVLEIMDYVGILNSYTTISDIKKRKEKQLQDSRDLILEVLDNKHLKVKQWYGFINTLRNFTTHEGVLTIDYVEDENIFFYKKHWDRRFKISMNTISKRLNKFLRVRKLLREGLSDVNFWKTKMNII
jgi:hypothetical protein